MLIAQRLPARLAERAGRFLLVIGHERVELLDVVHDVHNGPVGDQLAAVRPAARSSLLDVAQEVQRQQPELLAICAQARLIDATLGDELAEDRQRGKAREHRVPAQQTRLKRCLRLPLERVAQPGLLHDQEVVAGARSAWLVLAQRDPRVEPWAPRVVLPPLARVVGDQQMPVAAPEDPRPELRPAKLPAAPRALPDELVFPVLDRAVDQRAPRRAPVASVLLGQPDEPVHQQRVGRGDRQPGVDHPPQAVGEVALHRLGQRRQVKAAPLRPATQPPAKRGVIGQRPRRELRQPQLRRHLLPQRQVALLGVEAAAIERLNERNASDPAHPSSRPPSAAATARRCAAQRPQTPTHRGSASSGYRDDRGGG